jgi:hypothetical protein
MEAEYRPSECCGLNVYERFNRRHHPIVSIITHKNHEILGRDSHLEDRIPPEREMKYGFLIEAESSLLEISN